MLRLKEAVAWPKAADSAKRRMIVVLEAILLEFVTSDKYKGVTMTVGFG